MITKKVYACLVAGIMTLSLASCAGQGSANSSAGSESESSSGIGYKDPVGIRVSISGGMGAIATAEEGKATEFDPSHPYTNSFLTVERGSVIEIETRADEGYQFLKWTKDGKEYSRDAHITVTASEDAEYSAYFVSSFGYEGQAADSIDKAKTFADILALGYYEYACSDTEFSYVFEMNNTIYRVKADVSEDTAAKIFDIDFFDPDKDEKMIALLEPLEIKDVLNLSEMIPNQKELDALAGKTGSELTEDGWICSSWNIDENQYYLEKAPFRYVFEFDGEAKPNEEDDGNAVIKDLKVKSARYDGLSGASEF